MLPIELECLFNRFVAYRVTVREILSNDTTTRLIFLLNMLIIAGYRNVGTTELSVVEDEGVLCGSFLFEGNCRRLDILGRRVEGERPDLATVDKICTSCHYNGCGERAYQKLKKSRTSFSLISVEIFST